MDKIYECAAKFVALENYTYRFVVSQNRQSKELLLNFCDTDFFHLAGLHYLKDISLPQNRRETLKNIIEKKIITDQLLCNSRFYTHPKPDKDIYSRIDELRFLEEYLDTNNIIHIYNTRNDKYLRSFIKADYLIESQFKGSKNIVYIFLKQRNDNPSYLCISSFFKKNNLSYSGDKLYWLLKEKISHNKHTILYCHPNYKPAT